jgi:mono/diheme cytochrome c family protein
MKKFFKVLGIIILIILIVAAAGAAFISVRGIPEYAPGKIVLKVEPTPERLARGKKLVSILCKNCHFDNKTGGLTGHFMEEAPTEFGTIYSKNITQSKSYGIADWTDGEVAYLLRTGVNKHGKYTPPWMVKLPMISDEDLNSIIAFMRSDDPWVKAQDVPDKESEPSFLTKFLTTVAFKPLPFPTKTIVAPDTADHFQYGRYLAAGVVDCYACHSADFKKMDPLVPENTLGYFGGGNQLIGIDKQVIYSANLTASTTGIGNWTKDQFIGAVMFGRRPDGKQLRFPMVPYVNLDSSEVGAIYDYLRTIPKIENSVERNF